MRIPVGLTLGGLLLAAACSSSSTYGPGSGGGCSPTATQVCMVNLNTSFNPASLTIARGTTVTWKNGDGITHTTTSNPSNPAGCPAWNNTVGASGTSAGVTFSPSAAVTCQYFCSIHATATTGAMRGSIIVQ